jgi:hypothetical protein
MMVMLIAFQGGHHVTVVHAGRQADAFGYRSLPRLQLPPRCLYVPSIFFQSLERMDTGEWKAGTFSASQPASQQQPGSGQPASIPHKLRRLDVRGPGRQQ